MARLIRENADRVRELINSDILAYAGTAISGLKGSGRIRMACCPFHDDKTPSFSINTEKNTWRCYAGCRDPQPSGGDTLSLIMALEDLEFMEVIKREAKEFNIELFEKDEGESVAKILFRAGKTYQELLKSSDMAMTYLEGRGLQQKIIERFELGFAPNEWGTIRKIVRSEHQGLGVESGLLSESESESKGKKRVYDTLRGRVVFPVRDINGSICGYSGRVLPEYDEGRGQKYLNPRESDHFHKHSVLYGLYEARKAVRQSGVVFVYEGYFDVFGSAQIGVENCCAAMGTAISTEHFEQLFGMANKVVMVFDGDKAGAQAAKKSAMAAAAMVDDGSELALVFLERDEDPFDVAMRLQDKDRLINYFEEREVSLTRYLLDLTVEEAKGNKDPISKALSLVKHFESQYRIYHPKKPLSDYASILMLGLKHRSGGEAVVWGKELSLNRHPVGQGEHSEGLLLALTLSNPELIKPYAAKTLGSLQNLQKSFPGLVERAGNALIATLKVILFLQKNNTPLVNNPAVSDAVADTGLKLWCVAANKANLGLNDEQLSRYARYLHKVIVSKCQTLLLDSSLEKFVNEPTLDPFSHLEKHFG